MSDMTWQDRAVSATRETQFGAILNCALGREIPPPCFHGKAVVSSDGFLTCAYTDRQGNDHHGAFVGAVADLEGNIVGLSRHLALNPTDKAALIAALQAWIGLDYRATPGLEVAS